MKPSCGIYSDWRAVCTDQQAVNWKQRLPTSLKDGGDADIHISEDIRDTGY